MPSLRSRINLAAVPETVQIDLCACAIRCAAAAMATPEGREAIEKGKKEYLRIVTERNAAEAAKRKEV